ncbi:putative nuclease HARBI1 isoform X2 [Monomorium pharaonis]|nr:putative nuclease HARBI1 isoform X2 [Monomorium pharaonis]
MDLSDMDLHYLGDVSELSDIEEEEEGTVRAPKRYIRDEHNPFEFYNEKEFKRRFRFSKEAVLHGLLPNIEENLTKINKRGLPIPPVLQLLACLRFYATGSFQLVLGDIISISQSTVSRIIFRVSVLLAGNIHRIIKMPCSVDQINENRTLFRNLGYGNGGIGLPGVDGAIDCTHVRLTQTRFQGIEEIYRNRKGYFSLNVQAVVGPRMEFLDIVPEWPGSQHDSRIFQNSRIYMRYIRRELTGILIGDNGYPCLPFLITPVLNATTDEQLMYNNIHRRTRQIVERTFGVWKRRFPCLARGLTTKLITSTTIIVACAVLHNLSLIYDAILPEDEENKIYNNNDDDDDNERNPVEWQPAEGLVMRNALIERLFH